jgi:hypothetical protein
MEKKKKNFCWNWKYFCFVAVEKLDFVNVNLNKFHADAIRKGTCLGNKVSQVNKLHNILQSQTRLKLYLLKLIEH